MLIYIVILIISVILHELAHGYTAYSFGDSTAKDAGRLSPNPIKHIDPVGSLLVPFLLIVTGSSLLFGWAKPVPYNPYNLKGKYSEFCFYDYIYKHLIIIYHFKKICCL